MVSGSQRYEHAYRPGVHVNNINDHRETLDLGQRVGVPAVSDIHKPNVKDKIPDHETESKASLYAHYMLIA